MANEFIARNGLIAQSNSTVTGSVLITGDVGIGTTSPTSKLHVVTNASGPVTPETRSAVVAINTSTDLTYPNSIGLYATVASLQGFAIYGNNTSGFGYGGYFIGDGYFSNNVGIGKEASSVKLDVNGNATVTGSLRVTQGITGSLFGTSSWAISSSRSISSSYSDSSISASYALTSSYSNTSTSASYALTASYALNGGSGGSGGTSLGIVQAFSVGLQNIF